MACSLLCFSSLSLSRSGLSLPAFDLRPSSAIARPSFLSLLLSLSLSCLCSLVSLSLVLASLRWNPLVRGLDGDGFEPDAAHHRDDVHLRQLGIGKNEGGHGMDKGGCFYGTLSLIVFSVQQATSAGRFWNQSLVGAAP